MRIVGCGLRIVPRGQSHSLAIAEGLPYQHPDGAKHAVELFGMAGLVMKR